MSHASPLVMGMALTLSLLGPQLARAQQKPPPPNPQAPNLALPFPMGVQRGSTLELTLTGANLGNPTGVWLGFPAKVDIPADKNGKDNAKLIIKVDIPADAPIGVHGLRVANKHGVSNLRLLCVDDLPQVVEADNNRSKSTPQAVPVPSVVAGRTDAEASDYYKITVKAGQRVSIDVLARRLGSALDPQVAIYDGKGARELAYDNDSPGAQADARLAYTFKEAGDYLIEVKDVLNRGGADYVYRLRVGDFPLATVPIPMAAKRGSTVKVDFAGPSVDEAVTQDVVVPADSALAVIQVAPRGKSGQHGWPVPLVISNIEEKLEQESNQELGNANRLNLPSGVTGRFQVSDDLDNYIFSLKKGQKVTIEAQTLEWGSPTLVYLVVRNPKTKAELAKSNPQAVHPADQKIDFTAPEDGDFVLEVQHLNYLGGPSEAYHFTLEPTTAGFEVTLLTDRDDLSSQSVAAFPLQVTRRNFNGPIEVNPVTPAALVGSTTIKEGQTQGTLLVRAKGDLPLGPQGLRLQAKAVIDGKTVTQWVSSRTAVSGALAGLPYPPLHLTDQVAVGIKEKAPFALAVSTEHPQATPGAAAKIKISVKRPEGLGDEIDLSLVQGLPPNVPAPKLGSIAKDKSDYQFDLAINPKTPLGDYVLLFSGKVKRADKDKKDKTEISSDPAPVTLVVGPPFELKVEPMVVKLSPGGKEKIKVTAIRHAGYKGPIALEVRNLPGKVAAAKGTIAQDQNVVEIELAGPPDLPAAEAKNVDVLGTATALNNLQNASPAFTVHVPKK